MTHALHSPETPADAIFIARTLADPHIAPDLTERFGPEALESAHENALGWMVSTIDQAVPLRIQHGNREVVIRTARNIDETIPPALEVDLAEPLITEKAPAAFGASESQIILHAARKAAHEKGMRRLAMDFLARNAPTRTERALRRTALAATVNVLRLA